MTENEINQLKNEKKLLSDEEIADILVAEYDSQKKSRDDAAAKRQWDRISDAVKIYKRRKRFFRVQLPVLAAVVLVVAVVSTKAFKKTGPSEQGTQGAGGETSILLTSYERMEDSKFRELPSGAKLEKNRVVVFKVFTPKNTYVSLFEFKNSDAPKQVLQAQNVNSGREAFLEQGGGDVFGYQMEDKDHGVKFCAVSADTKAELQKYANTILDGKGFSLDGSCVLLSVP